MKIAVTGGIGSGKSTVVKLLREQLELLYRFESVDGWVKLIWDAREVYFSKGEIEKLIGCTTEAFSLTESEVMKKAASNWAFQSDANREALEDLFMKPVESFLNGSLCGPEDDGSGNVNVIIEFPLLFEQGWQERFDLIVNVTCSQEVRVERVKNRNPDWTEEKIRSVLATQFTDRKKFLHATNQNLAFLEIANDHGTQELGERVLEVTNEIKQRTLQRQHSKVGVVGGSFDPITLGHLWLVEQAAEIVDFVVILQAVNPTKKGLLSLRQREKLILKTISELPSAVRCRVCTQMLSHDDLLVSFAERIKAKFIFRGMRNFIDFQYENEQLVIQRRLAPELNIFYMVPPQSLTEVSSSLVRNVLHLRNWEAIVAPYVPVPVFKALLDLQARGLLS